MLGLNILSPLITALLLLTVVERWKRVGRKGRDLTDFVFREIPAAEIPAGHRRQFDRHADRFDELGMEFVGDFLLKENPIAVIDRIYWQSQPTTIAALCSCHAKLPPSHIAESAVGLFFAAFPTAVLDFLFRVPLQKVQYSFLTFLSDGVLVQTTNTMFANVLGFPHPDLDRFSLNYSSARDIEELYDVHEEYVIRMCQIRGVGVLKFDPSQLEDLLAYERNLLHQWQHRLGNEDEPEPVNLPRPHGVFACSGIEA